MVVVMDLSKPRGFNCKVACSTSSSAPSPVTATRHSMRDARKGLGGSLCRQSGRTSSLHHSSARFRCLGSLGASGNDGERKRSTALCAKGKKSKKGSSKRESKALGETGFMENGVSTTSPNYEGYIPQIVEEPAASASAPAPNGNGNGSVQQEQINGRHIEVHDVDFLQQKDLELEVLSTPNPIPESTGSAVVPSQNVNYQIQQYLKPLPRVLLLHTGGTLGMDPNQSYQTTDEGPANLELKEGTGGVYPSSDNLQPGEVLSDLMTAVPELSNFAHMQVEIVFNIDSCRIGPKQWVQLAKHLHRERQNYDAFLIVHGTDTMAFTAAALSLMLQGFKKPIVLTGSQLPLAMPRSDARQNLIDAITCATAACMHNPLSRYPVHFQEVAICFGGKLMRGNRTRKTHSSVYAAFDSPMYEHLAGLGVEVEWNHTALLESSNDVYQPRFKLNTNVIRVPIVPGIDPRKAYGDLYGRGVRGIVLEVFGVGNMPDNPAHGWLPWLKQQRKKGLFVYLCSQCNAGKLHPELYRSGSVALNMGVESGKQMTPECAVVKMMFCLEYKDIPLSQPIAGEL